ncbi:hypothetical protein CC79DRAFT_149667 [Sarocladium strictum]
MDRHGDPHRLGLVLLSVVMKSRACEEDEQMFIRIDLGDRTAAGRKSHRASGTISTHVIYLIQRSTPECPSSAASSPSFTSTTKLRAPAHQLHLHQSHPGPPSSHPLAAAPHPRHALSSRDKAAPPWDWGHRVIPFTTR